MTITFENDMDIIVYALEEMISYAQNYQDIFVAQSVRWISSIIGLQHRLVIYIDNLKVQRIIGKAAAASDTQLIHSSRLVTLQESSNDVLALGDKSINTTETVIHNEVIENYDILLEQPKPHRKAIGRQTRQASRVINKKVKPLKTFSSQTQGIDGSELPRWRTAGECECCAWPEDLIGGHGTIDCCLVIRKKIGTAHIPQQKSHHHF